MAAVILMDVVVCIQSSGDVMQCPPLLLNKVLAYIRSCMHTVCNVCAGAAAHRP
jgi:hypothetical protein